jgi:UDP-N-acetylglucosamine--N-acetylmuramyl-(pentapeptide) pyrophosphoryl-undecaprenol N-acetylglucosamine transferase
MTLKRTQFFFAGGGTGGHIYPALAIAEALTRRQPKSESVFFCSSRAVDARVLANTNYEFIPLPAEGFSLNPIKCVRFGAQFLKSYYFVKQILMPIREESVVIGTGGFVSAPVVLAAHSLKIPVYILNVDYVPGKANRQLARFAKTIFTQFAETEAYFPKYRERIAVVGCPLRPEFAAPNAEQARQALGLDADKKVILVTGASSGSLSINQAMLKLLPTLAPFADQWQVVHLTGQVHYEAMKAAAEKAAIGYHIVDYFDAMADLYAASDIIIGRSGAVSAAEYAAAGRASICLPYPYHKDKHQHLNASGLVNAGGAMIVEDVVGNVQQTASALRDALVRLMSDDAFRMRMAGCAKQTARVNAAEKIADMLLR